MGAALGSGNDFLLGFEPMDHVLVRGFLGYFLPGRAFEESDNALIARIKLEYGF